MSDYQEHVKKLDTHKMAECGETSPPKTILGNTFGFIRERWWAFIVIGLIFFYAWNVRSNIASPTQAEALYGETWNEICEDEFNGRIISRFGQKEDLMSDSIGQKVCQSGNEFYYLYFDKNELVKAQTKAEYYLELRGVP